MFLDKNVNYMFCIELLPQVTELANAANASALKPRKVNTRANSAKTVRFVFFLFLGPSIITSQRDKTGQRYLNMRDVIYRRPFTLV